MSDIDLLHKIERLEVQNAELRRLVERANKIIAEVAQASFVDDTIYPAMWEAQRYARALSSDERA